MTRLRQVGQSMTEYLVVLGVTGAALLAATTDVTTLFDNVDRSYSTQSTEMNKVQLYNSHKVRFNEQGPRDEDYDDGDTPPPEEGELPAPAIPHIELVYDAQGNLLGEMKDGYLIDEQGNPLAFCERTISGECVFVDEEGNILFPGASTSTQLVDDDGNELPLMALTASGKVYGFVYVYRDRIYSAADRAPLESVPSHFTAVPMRKVLELDANGVPHLIGYELDSQLYSLSAATDLNPRFDTPLAAEKKELVSVVFSTEPNSNWQGYKPCLVMPRGWRDALADLEDFENNQLTGVWESKFNDPALRLDTGGVGGFIDATADECRGASTVTHDPATGSWTLN